MKIIPAILSDQPSVISEQLELLSQLESEYEVETVQIDIIDGEFTDNITVTPLDLARFDFKNFAVDMHIMAIEPLDFVFEAKEVAETVPFGTVIGQVERMSSQRDFVDTVIKQGWQAGLCLNAYTPISALSREVLDQLQVLQIMGIEAGFQGQTFIEHTYSVVAEARKLIDQVNPSIQLIVDGGVKPEHLARLAELGVDSVVVGSVLWNSASVTAGMDSLYEALADVELEADSDWDE